MATSSLLLIVIPLAFNYLFWMLSKTFEYPEILRQDTGTVLEKFNAGGSKLKLIWWAFMLTAVGMVFVSLVIFDFLNEASTNVSNWTLILGVIAAVVQFLGLARWPFAVPYLARTYLAPESSEAEKTAVSVTFQMLNRFFGVGIGEHLGYLFTGLWTGIVGFGLLVVDFEIIGSAGIVIGSAMIISSLEFVGKNEEAGWKVAERITPITYIFWSIWLITLGLFVV